MAIDDNFFSQMCSTNVDNIHSMDFVLNLDVLNGCVHFCNGCFVEKERSNDWEKIVDKACRITEELSEKKNLRFRELILGPTDFFSAKNTIEILSSPKFQKLFSYHEKTRITASCILSKLDLDHFYKIFEILDNNENYRSNMILEFLIPLDAHKIISKDREYIEQNKLVLEFFKKNTPKIIDWSYVVNMGNNDSLKSHYADVVDFVKNEFGTILEFNPGFFRTNNNKLIDHKLSYWKKFIQDVMSNNNYKDLCLTSVDKHHNTANTVCLNLLEDEVFFSPFIYEQIIDKADLFLLNDLSADSILQKHFELQVQGFKYATCTNECLECVNLTSCVGRNVLNFMETRNLKDCVFPEKFKIESMI